MSSEKSSENVTHKGYGEFVVLTYGFDLDVNYFDDIRNVAGYLRLVKAKNLFTKELEAEFSK